MFRRGRAERTAERSATELVDERTMTRALIDSRCEAGMRWCAQFHEPGSQPCEEIRWYRDGFRETTAVAVSKRDELPDSTSVDAMVLRHLLPAGFALHDRFVRFTADPIIVDIHRRGLSGRQQHDEMQNVRHHLTARFQGVVDAIFFELVEHYGVLSTRDKDRLLQMVAQFRGR